jgi:hypothetical protein
MIQDFKIIGMVFSLCQCKIKFTLLQIDLSVWKIPNKIVTLKISYATNVVYMQMGMQNFGDLLGLDINIGKL